MPIIVDKSIPYFVAIAETLVAQNFAISKLYTIFATAYEQRLSYGVTVTQQILVLLF